MGKRKITYVIGHKNPDTDSICSAIGLAALKVAEGAENVVAARAGNLNPQTKFILKRLGVEPPVLLTDVRPRAADVMTRDVVTVASDTPVLKVMDLMREKRIKFVPVVENGAPVGIITLMDLAKNYAARLDPEAARGVTTTLDRLAETLGGGIVVDASGGKELALSVYVGAMSRESFLGAIRAKNPSSAAVVVGDRAAIQAAAVDLKVALVVISGGLEPAPGVVEAARANNVSVVKSPHDSATTALFLRLSSPARSICGVKVETSSPDEYVKDLAYRLSGSAALAGGLVVLGEDGSVRGVITKSDLLRSSGVELVLVDHNELSQAVPGAESVKIAGVVDHHRIGGFQTIEAIPFICDPVGSTSTLVSELYLQRGVEMPARIASLLLAGVLSDTVILKSPTTTERDRVIIQRLEELSGVDHAAFGREIFAATSSMKSRKAEDVVSADHKVFEAAGKKFGIGQIETIGFTEFYEERPKLMAELASLKEKLGLELSALLVTDIVYGTSLLLASADKKLLYNLRYPKIDDNLFELKDVISRKKQVVPHVIGVFGELY
jgi:manganese-dependent inorganic pyrophosphatase